MVEVPVFFYQEPTYLIMLRNNFWQKVG